MALGLWLVGLLISAFLMRQQQDNDAVLRQRFATVAEGVAQFIGNRLSTYEFGLRGARGAIVMNGGVDTLTRRKFMLYVASRNLEREFPGARGVGFIRRVPAARADSFEAAARADDFPEWPPKSVEPF